MCNPNGTPLQLHNHKGTRCRGPPVQTRQECNTLVQGGCISCRETEMSVLVDLFFSAGVKVSLLSSLLR